jgi:hypothetical protein
MGKNDEILETFRNNLFCRRDSNQRKARLLWEDIRNDFDQNIQTLFEIEWSHYMRGELSPNDFSHFYHIYIKNN